MSSGTSQKQGIFSLSADLKLHCHVQTAPQIRIQISEFHPKLSVVGNTTTTMNL